MPLDDVLQPRGDAKARRGHEEENVLIGASVVQMPGEAVSGGQPPLRRPPNGNRLGLSGQPRRRQEQGENQNETRISARTALDFLKARVGSANQSACSDGGKAAFVREAPPGRAPAGPERYQPPPSAL